MGNLTSCISGIIFISIGLVMKLYPPEHINKTMGYRTPFAMKSKDTWLEGNRFFGIMLLIGGAIFIPFSILINHLYNSNTDLATKILGVSLSIILLMIILCTEIHLRNLFNKDGIKKEEMIIQFLHIE
ncbi:putative membrane protein [Clostridium tetanomorphum]|uniref:SdpI family protein n=1 Tax=Clostridium tetanomorphum TaxID=1553 RepID=A0A923IZB2_CLOTT|nr:SdpI family protein [Clostridium tetanomorphum]KAJ49719.1 hypothetical protein CTM_21568 [Clostridium tetanomorphum DSM 665]KAJ52638.1 hypothetical protein CTM_06621 [Clostridium tetanomorphum DSM 665]MBC2396807.1 SdpI family protein [Clostridium tetanomorphum]MBP1863231.1 putative membrane protein [Clostridium tetanomorphum]NRS84339.1 putative membrane protein [Clostridium tetanomorphum]